jgi:hypothetical protein
VGERQRYISGGIFGQPLPRHGASRSEAKTPGVTFPITLLGRADEVTE